MHEIIQYLLLAGMIASSMWSSRRTEEQIFEQHQKIKKLQRALTATQLRVFNAMDKEELPR